MDFDNFDLINFAKPLRYNTILFPNGTNVSIYKIKTDNLVRLRTYERGVEAETGACGTARCFRLDICFFQKNYAMNPINYYSDKSNSTKIHYSEKYLY
jgi:diaminopimelate epimerase